MDTAAKVSVVSAAVAIFGAIATGATAILTAYFSFQGKNRELDIKLVEVGVAILRADPN